MEDFNSFSSGLISILILTSRFVPDSTRRKGEESDPAMQRRE